MVFTVVIFCYRGAVSRDGRIQPGDIILAVNGESLEGKSNKQAVALLRQAVQSSRYVITATICPKTFIHSLESTSLTQNPSPYTTNEQSKAPITVSTVLYEMHVGEYALKT